MLQSDRHLKGALLVTAGLLLTVAGADAAKLTTLYSFCPTAGCADGVNPYAPLAADAAGNLYGTTVNGGNSSDHGTIYELRKVAKGYKYRRLHQFCHTSCDDGGGSYGGLVVDTAGNLYGTTTLGSARGVVYMLTPQGDYTVLHHFCQTDCNDGSFPAGGLTYESAETGALYDGSSPLYGATENGGTSNEGVIYSLTPGGAETALYNFGGSATDLVNPNTTLTPDGSGNLYCVAPGGGEFNHGSIFKVTTAGHAKIVHSFCARTNCTDGGTPGGEGSFPGGALLLDSAGDLFGTVPNGDKFGEGVLYRSSQGRYQVLYSFCRKSNCTDGAKPEGGLTMDVSGNLHGVAPIGGDPTTAAGIVFEYSKTLKVVHTFCVPGPCTDGAAPISKLLAGADGEFFGTTQQGGGASDGGTVFELTP